MASESVGGASGVVATAKAVTGVFLNNDALLAWLQRECLGATEESGWLKGLVYRFIRGLNGADTFHGDEAIRILVEECKARDIPHALALGNVIAEGVGVFNGPLVNSPSALYRCVKLGYCHLMRSACLPAIIHYFLWNATESIIALVMKLFCHLHDSTRTMLFSKTITRTIRSTRLVFQNICAHTI